MPLPFHRRRLDPDAADFCRRSGATDRAAINAFVRGVKDLGLWNNMVCWPLRSSQNAGFGDTAYSLGGLGTFNGTLVNLSSGAWGASGITNSATGHITTNYFETGGSQTHIFVGNSTTANALRAYGSTLSNANTKGMRFRDDAALFGDGALQGAFVDVTSAGNFKMASAIYQRPTNSPVFLNKTQAGTLVAGNAMVAGENSLTLLAAKDISISQYYSGQAAFYATVRSAITTAQYLAFYDLYRNTLGTGLGLPDYDPATIEYANRSGATDLANIDAFVRGVKDLGLWDSMVCWPLRSAQNAGNGDTVHSLGGLGTYNGTRVNGPTWGADGIDFTDESNEHILTTFTPAVTDDFYMFAAYEGNAQGANNNVLASTRTTGIAKGFTLSSNWTNVHRAIVWSDTTALEAVGSGGFTDGSYNTATMRGNVSGATLVAGITVNDGAETTASLASSVSAANPIMLGNESASGPRSLGGMLSFAGYFKSASINTSAFRSLYKSTLGTGLNLP